jgi:hypothetical protein
VTAAERRAKDVDTLVAAVIEFGNWCVNEAWLVPAEVQRDVWLIHHISFYIGQVNNGGHGQFAGNSGMEPQMLDDLDAGLDTLGLHDLLAIFRRFRRDLDSDRNLKRAVMEGCGFGDIPDAARAADDAFFRSPEREQFYPRATCWLKQASSVVTLTPREIRRRKEAIVAANAKAETRRAAESAGSPLESLTGVWLRIWDKSGLRRPGESDFGQTRRRFADAAHWPSDLSHAETELVRRYGEAIGEADNDALDDIFAVYRDLHARYRLDTLTRWPSDIRGYAYRLFNAGEKLGRVDLLDQAADAWGRAIGAGPPQHDYDPGGPWRHLGQSLIALARLDEAHLPGIVEAPALFERALELDRTQPVTFGYQVRDLVGLAEAHLLLASLHPHGGHLNAACAALDEARPLLRIHGRDQWRAVNAERLALLPRADVRAHERMRAICGLDLAIAREVEDEGGSRFNPTRLTRLRSLRARLSRQG